MLEKIYVKNPDVVFRKIANEFILMPVRQKVVDLKSIYTLNEPAAFIWELIDGKNSISYIKGKVSEAFDCENARIDSDINDILDKFKSLVLIEEACLPLNV